jgi:hypothetical protein
VQSLSLTKQMFWEGTSCMEKSFYNLILANLHNFQQWILNTMMMMVVGMKLLLLLSSSSSWYEKKTLPVSSQLPTKRC